MDPIYHIPVVFNIYRINLLPFDLNLTVSVEYYHSQDLSLNLQDPNSKHRVINTLTLLSIGDTPCQKSRHFPLFFD